MFEALHLMLLFTGGWLALTGIVTMAFLIWKALRQKNNGSTSLIIVMLALVGMFIITDGACRLFHISFAVIPHQHQVIRAVLNLGLIFSLGVICYPWIKKRMQKQTLPLPPASAREA